MSIRARRYGHGTGCHLRRIHRRRAEPSRAERAVQPLRSQLYSLSSSPPCHNRPHRFISPPLSLSLSSNHLIRSNLYLRLFRLSLSLRYYAFLYVYVRSYKSEADGSVLSVQSERRGVDRFETRLPSPLSARNASNSSLPPPLINYPRLTFDPRIIKRNCFEGGEWISTILLAREKGGDICNSA